MMSANVRPPILLMGAHRWRRQSVIDDAVNRGFEPVLLLCEGEELSTPAIPNAAAIRVIQTSFDFLSPTEIATAVKGEQTEWYVIGLDDYVCRLAAEISEYSSCRTMPPSAAMETLRKHLLRKRWNNLCAFSPSLFPVPYRLLRYADSSFRQIIGVENDLAIDLEKPLVVKPNALDASIGIHRISNGAELESALKSIEEQLRQIAVNALSLGIKVEPEVLIEQAIPRSMQLHSSAEFSAEFISLKTNSRTKHICMGITEKYIDQSTCVEVAHVFPSEYFPRELTDAVVYAITKLLDQLQVVCAISHWEIIACEDGRVALVEAQLRPAGDRIMALIERSTGQSPYDALFSGLRGSLAAEAISFVPKQSAAVFFVFPECPVLGRFKVQTSGTEAELFGKSIFVEPDFYDLNEWSNVVNWESRHMALITDGVNFNACKSGCEAILNRLSLRHHDRFGHVKETRLMLRAP